MVGVSYSDTVYLLEPNLRGVDSIFLKFQEVSHFHTINENYEDHNNFRGGGGMRMITYSCMYFGKCSLFAYRSCNGKNQLLRINFYLVV